MKTKAEHLLVDGGPLKGQRLSVPEDGLYCGRDASCGLPIPDDSLSRRHARLFFRTGQMWVQDLKGVNGTLVNGQPVDAVQLKRGDHVQLGNTAIKVMHDQLFPTQGIKERLARRPDDDAGETPKGQPLALLAALLWLVLIAWLAFLAFSLCLPAPTPEVVETEAAPTPVSVPTAPAAPPPRVTEAPRPVEAPVAPSNEEVLQPLFDLVARRLAAEDFTGALDTLHRQSAVYPDDAEQALLGELRAYLTEVATLDARVAAGLHAQSSGRLELRRTDGRPMQVRVVAVSATRLRAVLLGGETDREINVDIAKLHPADRLGWLPPAQTPPQHAMRCILNLRAGNREAAGREASQAGLLAAAFTALAQTAAPGTAR